MTKLFDATCVTKRGRNLESFRAGVSVTLFGRPGPAKLIVKFTLTQQRRRNFPETADAAWTLHSLSCTTTTGKALARKRDRYVPPSGPRGSRV